MFKGPTGYGMFGTPCGPKLGYGRYGLLTPFTYELGLPILNSSLIFSDLNFLKCISLRIGSKSSKNLSTSILPVRKSCAMFSDCSSDSAAAVCNTASVVSGVTPADFDSEIDYYIT